jgi:ribosomal RNA-processing protein 12
LHCSFHLQHAGGDVKKNGIEPYSYVPLSSVAGKQRGGSKGPKMDITGHKKGSKK